MRHCEPVTDVTGVAIRFSPGRESPLVMHLSGLAAGKCEPPLPVADEGGAHFPQPRLWRAVAKQARERQRGKALCGFPRQRARWLGMTCK